MAIIMRFSQEAKNMLAMTALVFAVALALNALLAPAGNRDMWSWTISLLAVAVVLWIWSRRDSTAEREAEAAEAAAQEAEELAKRTIVRHADEPAEKLEERSEPDDLTRINGIGAVFQTVLNEAGISTYNGLASASVEDLEAIFDAAGRSRPGRLETWTPQAEFAAKDDWEGLREYLDSLGE